MPTSPATSPPPPTPIATRIHGMRGPPLHRSGTLLILIFDLLGLDRSQLVEDRVTQARADIFGTDCLDAFGISLDDVAQKVIGETQDALDGAVLGTVFIRNAVQDPVQRAWSHSRVCGGLVNGPSLAGDLVANDTSSQLLTIRSLHGTDHVTEAHDCPSTPIDSR